MAFFSIRCLRSVLRCRVYIMCMLTCTLISISAFTYLRISEDDNRTENYVVDTFPDTGNNDNVTVDPHEYNTTVDLRIIVMTLNRPESLELLLQTVDNLHTDGETVALDIWIDVGSNGEPDNKTFEVASRFRFRLGAKAVHLHTRHAGIFGQWINTWRPKLDTNEMALLLEDDVLISPHAWRWLKLVHSKYRDWDKNAGYTLQCQAETFMGSRKPFTTQLQPNDVVYGYKALGTWGFAPHPEKWRLFQDWLRKVQADQFFKPYVDGLIATDWFKQFEKDHFEYSMWSMWHICYTHFNNLLIIYSNLTPRQPDTTNSSTRRDGGRCLSVHTQGAGLHYKSHQMLNITYAMSSLLSNWTNHFSDFPKSLKLFHYNGEQI